MNYDVGLIVYDEKGTPYKKISDDVYRVGENCVMFEAAVSQGKKAYVRLYEYSSKQEAEEFYAALGDALENYKEYLCGIVPLVMPFMGYVIDGENTVPLCFAINKKCGGAEKKKNAGSLAMAVLFVKKMNENGLVVCGAADDCIAVTENGVKLCAPDRIFPEGSFIGCGGAQLCRPPEALDPAGHLASASEFSYAVAVMASKLFYGSHPYEKYVLREEPQEAEKDDDAETDPFEFGGNFEFTDNGCERIFGDTELLEPDNENEETDGEETGDELSAAQLEERIAEGSVQWYKYYLEARSGRESTEKIFSLMGSEKLCDMIERALCCDTGRDVRPDMDEWYNCIFDIFCSYHICGKCGNGFNIKHYAERSRHVLICPFRKEKLPPLYRIEFYEYFPYLEKLIAEEVKSDYLDSAVIQKCRKKLLGYRVIAADDKNTHKVFGRELYEEDSLSKCVMVRYGIRREEDGRERIVLAFPKDAEHIAGRYVGTIVNGEKRLSEMLGEKDGYVRFAVTPGSGETAVIRLKDSSCTDHGLPVYLHINVNKVVSADEDT